MQPAGKYPAEYYRAGRLYRRSIATIVQGGQGYADARTITVRPSERRRKDEVRTPTWLSPMPSRENKPVQLLSGNV